jgi:xylan 1,4-beta-xylosidase
VKHTSQPPDSEGARRETEGIENAAIVNYPDKTFMSPVDCKAEPYSRAKRYSFDTEIDEDFKTLRTARDPAVYSLTARKGFLRLRGGQSPVSCFNQTLLARRQTDFCFAAETYLEFEPTSFQEFAGFCYRYDENNQYLLALSHDEHKGKVLAVHSMIAGVYSRTDDLPVPADLKGIYLGVTVHERTGFFRYSFDGKLWQTLRPVLDSAVLSDEFDTEAFTGAFVGMFCVDTARYAACADFGYFAYTPL